MTQRRAKSAGGSSGGESPGSSASSRTRRLRNKPNDAIVEEEEDEEYDEEPTAGREADVEEEGEEEDEEEDENTGEVTRCICGHQEVPQQAIKNSKVPVDVGLFIQCETCQVWQHGFCVGFMSEEEVPDVYHCEKCKPERHLIVVRPGAKTSTYYPNGAPEATWEPVPTLDEKQPRKKQATERAAKEKRQVRTKSPTPETPEKPTKNGAQQAMSLSKKRRITMNSRDAAYEETLKRVLEESAHDLDQKLDLKVEQGEEIKEEENGNASDKKRRSPEPEERVTKRARRTPKSRKASDEDTEAPAVSETPATLPPPSTKGKGASIANGTAAHSSGNNSAAKESTPSKKKRPKSKKATPRQNVSKAAQQQNTESKPRIPPPRATIPEMRKRVAAILEFVGRTQGDAARENEDRRHLLEERNGRYKFLFPETGQPDDSKFQSMFEKYTVKHEKLADLSQKLIMWEKNYGSYDPNAEDE